MDYQSSSAVVNQALCSFSDVCNYFFHLNVCNYFFSSFRPLLISLNLATFILVHFQIMKAHQPNFGQFPLCFHHSFSSVISCATWCVTSLSLWQQANYPRHSTNLVLSHFFLISFPFLSDFLKPSQQKAKEPPWLSCSLTFITFNAREILVW